MRFRFEPGKGLIVGPTRLSGPSGDAIVRLALDTGAVGTMVSSEALVTLGYDPARITERIRITSATATEYAPQVVVARIEALGHTRDEFTVVCHTLPPESRLDGVLGLDFPSARRLAIDFAAGILDPE